MSAGSPAAPRVRVLGVRHHGPGSARALAAALEDYRPDCVLVEGPSDADQLIEWVADAAMRPPVALLAWQRDQPANAAFWPMAVFSPEWQALSWAVRHGVEAHFMDLPAAVALAPDDSPDGSGPAGNGHEDGGPTGSDHKNSGPGGNDPVVNEPDRDGPAGDDRGGSEPAVPGRPGGRSSHGRSPVESASGESASGERTPGGRSPKGSSSGDRSAQDRSPGDRSPEEPGAGVGPAPGERPDRPVHLDPIGELARVAGYNDPEAWWEDAVELRRAGDPFDGITEAVRMLRETTGADRETLRREAHMRKILRAARRRGSERIAVVCGAWHAPALAGRAPAVKDDNALLKGAAKVKASLTWVPWTHSRLASATGYGAGVDSPGWYHHLFTAPDEPVARWLTLVARSLREHDLPVSSAHVIEATRLAEALAALRGRPQPGLDEVNEATWSVLCGGSSLQSELVTREVIVGQALGEVPENVPMVPLDADLRATARRLRLAMSATSRTINLDLRRPNDLAKSQLLLRLGILGIDWGHQVRNSGTGTFKESWELEWRPELSVSVVEAATFGNTVATAAGSALLTRTSTLQEVTSAVEQALAADLGEVLPELLRALDERAAGEPDVLSLMESVPALARAMRYGDVRGTDTRSLGSVARAVLARACAGLPAAASGTSEDAATALCRAVDGVQRVIMLLDEKTVALWRQTLRSLLASRTLPGLLSGRVVRLLNDAGELDGGKAAQHLGRALSPGSEPEYQAHWIEGFLEGSALLLLEDRRLLRAIDDWATRIPDEVFLRVLPALRRAFGVWSPAERRHLAARIARIDEPDPLAVGEEEDLSPVLPVLDTVALITGGRR